MIQRVFRIEHPLFFAGHVIIPAEKLLLHGDRNMEELEIVQRFRRGDEDAFEWIFRRYFSPLCLYAEHFTKSRLTAEEITEDFFCHFWDQCHELNIDTSLKGYLFRGIRNRCLNYIRNQKVQQKHFDNKLSFALNEYEAEHISPEEPASDLINRELETQIGKLIDQLPDQCKTIFCLNRFENLTYPEIAAKLNISVNTVKTQMTRALCKLRAGLEEYL